MKARARKNAGIARGRRLFAGAEAKFVPQARLSGPMPWVIAIMVAMTAIALAAGLALGNTVTSATAEISGGVTVQVVEPREDVRQQEAARALDALKGESAIASMRLVPQEELDALVSPWLGGGVDVTAGIGVPVPALIDVRLKQAATPERIAAIRRALAPAAPSARVDAQAEWLKPVFDAIVSLQWLALVLVALLAMALSAAVLLAARSALGANRDTIEIVHLLGGTDAQIARVFQRSLGVDAAGGGLVGLLLAGIVIVVLGRRFAGLSAGLVSSGALVWSDWLLLVLVPLLATALAMITARLTVMHALRKML
ncbi:cell division transport system permease protein [Novosphingobium fluoreni]|uniref:Cell division transport system permease protein n=1 Tax=Novosphingobium fluoreni TaxID=1391222 RepID=A0A7W6C8A3_9SPHN|nr:cell division protein [Novosphingobium fluoreni]MBB3941426.1 cell division transport system permease protein [Novosphingobium fluoreni]